mgnify:CR=1 FL=1
MKSFIIPILVIFVVFQSCKTTTNQYHPTRDFSEYKTPASPDYTNLRDWAAHPDKKDLADSLPVDVPFDIKDEQTLAEVDVFFCQRLGEVFHKGDDFAVAGST